MASLSSSSETFLEKMAYRISHQYSEVCKIALPTWNFQVGDVVTIHEDSLVPGKWPLARIPGKWPLTRVPGKWPLARVQEIHPGKVH